MREGGVGVGLPPRCLAPEVAASLPGGRMDAGTPGRI